MMRRSCAAGHQRHSALLLLAVALVSTVGLSVAANIDSEMASAHALFGSSEPANGSTIGSLPDRVVVRVLKKQATSEGDPLRVIDPSGNRVDTGDVRINEGGAAISVGLKPNLLASGIYFVNYKIISADSHLIEDNLHFTVGRPASGVTGVAATPDRLLDSTDSGALRQNGARPQSLNPESAAGPQFGTTNTVNVRGGVHLTRVGTIAASVVGGLAVLAAFVVALRAVRRARRLAQPEPGDLPLKLRSDGTLRRRPPAGAPAAVTVLASSSRRIAGPFAPLPTDRSQ